MSLQEFLNKPKFSHSREALFNHKLLYDLKLVAARAGYHLSVYFPDVDHEGFDIILDDGDNLKKIQLKTVVKNSGRKQIKPTPYNGFKVSGITHRGNRLGISVILLTLCKNVFILNG